MNIEEYIISYLSTALTWQVNSTTISIPVSGDVPSPVPDRFVTVEMTGADRNDKICFATIAVQSWETSRADASELNDRVIAAMEAMVAQPEISRSALDTSYNYTDLTRNKPRYQAVFTVVY